MIQLTKEQQDARKEKLMKKINDLLMEEGYSIIPTLSVSPMGIIPTLALVHREELEDAKAV